jgi:hypothetical protein
MKSKRRQLSFSLFDRSEEAIGVELLSVLSLQVQDLLPFTGTKGLIQFPDDRRVRQRQVIDLAPPEALEFDNASKIGLIAYPRWPQAADLSDEFGSLQLRLSPKAPPSFAADQLDLAASGLRVFSAEGFQERGWGHATTA